jgi:queuine/archaeosine tRNA-ribosyltransferase
VSKNLIHSKHRLLKLNGRTISCPILWLGHDQKHPFKVWKYLDGCQCVMPSAHQFFERPEFFRLAATQGIHAAMEHTGHVFLDSGGYQFQRKEAVQITAEDVLNLYEKVSPDIGAVLDVPLNPLDTPARNWRRWQKTLEHTAYMYQNNDSCTLVPVIHTYNISAVHRRYEQLHNIFPNPLIVAIGSLVPFMRGSYIGKRFTRSDSTLSVTCQRWQFIVRLVLKVRDLFKNATLHVFGAGSLSTIYILFLLGVDSFDSGSWRMKAAYGSIILPGSPERYPSSAVDRVRIRRQLSKHDQALLELCECPVCAGQKMERLIRICPHRSKVEPSTTLTFCCQRYKGYMRQLIRVL